jgi:hypothetical protein
MKAPTIAKRWSIGVIAVVTMANDCPFFFGDPKDDVPSVLEIDDGDDQSAGVGQQLPRPLVVVVRNRARDSIPGAEVVFQVTLGGGSLSDDTVTTASNGRASTRWTLGATPGTEHEVTAKATSGAATAVKFRATATP